MGIYYLFFLFLFPDIETIFKFSKITDDACQCKEVRDFSAFIFYATTIASGVLSSSIDLCNIGSE